MKKIYVLIILTVVTAQNAHAFDAKAIDRLFEAGEPYECDLRGAKASGSQETLVRSVKKLRSCQSYLIEESSLEFNYQPSKTAKCALQRIDSDSALNSLNATFGTLVHLSHCQAQLQTKIRYDLEIRIPKPKRNLTHSVYQYLFARDFKVSTVKWGGSSVNTIFLPHNRYKTTIDFKAKMLKSLKKGFADHHLDALMFYVRLSQ